MGSTTSTPRASIARTHSSDTGPANWTRWCGQVGAAAAERSRRAGTSGSRVSMSMTYCPMRSRFVSVRTVTRKPCAASALYCASVPRTSVPAGVSNSTVTPVWRDAVASWSAAAERAAGGPPRVPRQVIRAFVATSVLPRADYVSRLLRFASPASVVFAALPFDGNRPIRLGISSACWLARNSTIRTSARPRAQNGSSRMIAAI